MTRTQLIGICAIGLVAGLGVFALSFVLFPI
jgi:hypothetical protein